LHSPGGTPELPGDRPVDQPADDRDSNVADREADESLEMEPEGTWQGSDFDDGDLTEEELMNRESGPGELEGGTPPAAGSHDASGPGVAEHVADPDPASGAAEVKSAPRPANDRSESAPPADS